MSVKIEHQEHIKIKQPAQSAQPARSREGSPWIGLWAVVTKEMADSLTSIRMFILEMLIVLTAAGTVYAARKACAITPVKTVSSSSSFSPPATIPFPRLSAF